MAELTDSSSVTQDSQVQSTPVEKVYDHYQTMEACGGIAYPEDINVNGKAECDQDKILDSAIAKAKSEKKPLVIIFGADWCGPCRNFAKTIKNASKEVKHDIDDAVVLAKINVNRGSTGYGVLKRLGLSIRSIPTGYIYTDANGLEDGKVFYPSAYTGNPEGFRDFLKEIKK